MCVLVKQIDVTRSYCFFALNNFPKSSAKQKSKMTFRNSDGDDVQFAQIQLVRLKLDNTILLFIW